MKSLHLLLNEWRNGPRNNLRLGQYFINYYIGSSLNMQEYLIDELWEADAGKATQMIKKWLEDNQYINELPPKV